MGKKRSKFFKQPHLSSRMMEEPLREIYSEGNLGVSGEVVPLDSNGQPAEYALIVDALPIARQVLAESNYVGLEDSACVIDQQGKRYLTLGETRTIIIPDA